MAAATAIVAGIAALVAANESKRAARGAATDARQERDRQQKQLDEQIAQKELAQQREKTRFLQAEGARRKQLRPSGTTIKLQPESVLNSSASAPSTAQPKTLLGA